MNSLRLSAKDEKSLEKTMTTRELAEVLGVDVKTIQRAVDSLDIDVERVGSSHTMVFNEAQATVIKKEIQKHHNLQADLMTTKQIAEQFGTSKDVILANARKCLPNKIIEHNKPTFWTEAEVTVILEYLKSHSSNNRSVEFNSTLAKTTTKLTPALKIKKAMELMQEGYEEELSILRAKNAEMQPKALVYDKICNADGLKPVEQVASNLGWGKNNFFALMRGMGIFFYSSKDADGRKTNLPKREYVERGYFVTKEEPYTRGDKDRLYTKIYVTGKGEAWLARKIDEATEDSAGKWIEREAQK